MIPDEKILYFLISLLIFVSLTGCGTMISQNVLHENPRDKGQPSPKAQNEGKIPSFVYSGTQMDAHMIKAPFDCLSGKEGGEGCWGVIAFSPILIIGGIIDLPLSFIADTLILPYTIYKDSKK
jgi:uncharacterized protein YceK